jgi:branched-chain amino acid transport system substrate-binding protein
MGNRGSGATGRPTPRRGSRRAGYRQPQAGARNAGLALGCLALGALLAACSGSSEPASTPVEVGVAVPFAGTDLMLEARQGWEIVLDAINESGGVGGRPLRVVERDTQLAAAYVLAPIADGFIDLTSQGYRYIISLISGAALEPMMRAATSRGVLAMSITSEEPAAQVEGYDALLLRGILATDRLIDKQAHALQGNGLTHMVIVGPTRGGAPDARHAAMRAAYAACGSCAVGDVTYPAESDGYLYDWRGLGQRVQGLQPDVIYLASADGSALMDSVRAIDLAGYRGLYYFAYGGYLAAVVPAFGPEVTRRFRSYDLALAPGAKSDEFLARYQALYGDSFVPEPRLIAFADYLALLALAMTRVGTEDPALVAETMKELAGPPGDAYGPLDFAAASAAVRAGEDIDFVGLSGPLDFDARGEVADGFALEYGVDPTGSIVPVR